MLPSVLTLLDFAAGGVVQAPVAERDDGAGSGKYPNEEETIHWLRSLFPVEPPTQKRAAKPPKKKEAIQLAAASEWASQPDFALLDLITESEDLRGIIDARREYLGALQEFKLKAQREAQAKARRVVLDWLKKRKDEEELTWLLAVTDIL